MLKNLNKFILVFLLVNLPASANKNFSASLIGTGLPSLALAKTQVGHNPIFVIKNKKSVYKNYLKLHKEFSEKVCRPGTEPKFWEKMKDYRGDGHYIPTLDDGSLDRVSIEKNLPEIKLKKLWITTQKKKVSNIKSFDNVLKKVKQIEKLKEQLIDYKREYQEASNHQIKGKVLAKSKLAFSDLKKAFEELNKKISYLQSYNFPVDFLKLRKSYDDVKYSEKKEDKVLGNQIYFYRKIVEDGAHDKDHTKGDRYFRALLSTLQLNITDEIDLISEDLRYDLESALDSVRHHISRGKSKLIERLTEWEKRTNRSYKFYISLLNERPEKLLNILEHRSSARYSLREFSLNKMFETYSFWKKQTEIMRSLFVIETILFNEVGRVDGPGGPERRDIAQVVINRTHLPEYRQFSEQTGLFEKLQQSFQVSEIQKSKWLNTLFKDGEFSFTFYFIAGNVRIYCPDMTRAGRKLRRENLFIAMDMLNRPNYDFDALRYFSRASMLGRIDMTSLWDDFEPVPERPGRLATRTNQVKKLYKKGKYDFLYYFTSVEGKSYKVIEVKNRNYVLPLSEEKLYSYRNPHLFKYFRLPIPAAE